MTEQDFIDRLNALFNEAADSVGLEQIEFLTEETLDAFYGAEKAPDADEFDESIFNDLGEDD